MLNNKEQPVQIVTVSGDSSFSVNAEALHSILSPVANTPVAIISVAGAFRTGKSFLLDIFLRHLRHREKYPDDPAYNVDQDVNGESTWLMGGSSSDVPSLLEGGETTGSSSTGFAWKRGDDRVTTGMWLWSRPYIIIRNKNARGRGRSLAVLLMDTQGLGDSETTRKLTNAIFGLSVLISSYQIFNLTHSLQDGHLQELALFTEYANVVNAAAREADQSSQVEETDSSTVTDNDQKKESFSPEIDRASRLRLSLDPITSHGVSQAPEGNEKRTKNRSAAIDATTAPPFQRLEFLIRDANGGIESDPNNVEALGAEMRSYLERAFIAGSSKSRDLTMPREHLRAMFEKISCFKLPYPNKAVAEGRYSDKRVFDGNMREIALDFRTLVERYTNQVFSQLEAKKVGGRELVGSELESFAVAFCTEFQKEGSFPVAQNMLDAVSTVNNDNAYRSGREAFVLAMNGAVGEGMPFLEEKLYTKVEEHSVQTSLMAFDKRANFGPRNLRAEKRRQLLDEIDKLAKEYKIRNSERDMTKAAQPFLQGLLAMFTFYVFRIFIDSTCSPFLDICTRISSFLVLTNTVLLVFLVYTAFQHGSETFKMLTKNYPSIAGLSQSLQAFSTSVERNDDSKHRFSKREEIPAEIAATPAVVSTHATGPTPAAGPSVSASTIPESFENEGQTETTSADTISADTNTADINTKDDGGGMGAAASKGIRQRKRIQA
jgi:atlastin